MNVPKRLFYPVEYNPIVDSRQSEYEQRRRQEEDKKRKQRDWYRLQLQEEQYEADARAIEGKGRR
jgi:hypothetical protein